MAIEAAGKQTGAHATAAKSEFTSHIQERAYDAHLVWQGILRIHCIADF